LKDEGGVNRIMKQGKIWGCNFPLFDKNNVEINGIHVHKGGYCSLHRHQHKNNIFFVVSGSLSIEVMKNDYPLTDVTTLKAGEMTDVAPKEWHKFKANEDTFAIEIYYVELDTSDIERKDQGGIECKDVGGQNASGVIVE